MVGGSLPILPGKGPILEPISYPQIFFRAKFGCEWSWFPGNWALSRKPSRQNFTQKFSLSEHKKHPSVVLLSKKRRQHPVDSIKQQRKDKNCVSQWSNLENLLIPFSRYLGSDFLYGGILGGVVSPFALPSNRGRTRSVSGSRRK